MTEEQYKKANEIQEKLSRIKSCYENGGYVMGVAFGNQGKYLSDAIRLSKEYQERIKIVLDEYVLSLTEEFEKL